MYMQHQDLSPGIIPDRSPQLIGNPNKQLAARLGAQWNFSTARRPQRDGHTERVNGASNVFCVTLFGLT